MTCTAQMFVDAMAVRRHLKRVMNGDHSAVWEKMGVTDDQLIRAFFVGAKVEQDDMGDLERVSFIDGSVASRSPETNQHVVERIEVC